ncbi:MAG: hypothetical protein M3Y30_04405 [Gemmatimonadota bacterium]|nr:hypothetical protein [Gemmatimonadota bacterium]
MGGAFTQQDVTNGNVTYVNDGAESTTDNFTWDLTDGGHVIPPTGSIAFNITITPVNDSPTIVNNPLSSLAEGGTAILSDARLLAFDAESTVLTFTFISNTRGQLQKKSGAGVFTALVPNATFTQQDITNGNVRFVDPGTDDPALQAQMNTVASFSWRVADADGAVNPPTGSNVSTFTITPVDDAPTVSWRSQSCAVSGTNVPANPLISLSDPDNVLADYSVCLVSIGSGLRVSPSTSTQGGSTATVNAEVQNGTTNLNPGSCVPANALSNLNLDSSANFSRGSLTWKLVKGGVQVGPTNTVQFPVTPTSC